ncbi:MAG: hypothetical protein Q9O74_02920 [Planctomycetota bacterium]|nr:hypothetical protein [Planctomycetota bacterium]
MTRGRITQQRNGGSDEAYETVHSLRAVTPSLAIDDRDWDELNTILSSRYPFGSSGIDWSEVEALVETTLRSRSAVPEFVRAAIGILGLLPDERLLLIGDHVFNETLTLTVADLAPCVTTLIGLPLGFIIGPSDGNWDWIIDIRFAGAAWAGRAPEVIG